MVSSEVKHEGEDVPLTRRARMGRLGKLAI
jgi:hypothetical protein